MSQDLLDTQLYALIGQTGFDDLVAKFYARIPADDILGQMYEKRDLHAAQLRLRDFLIQRFGGPDDYSQKRGHPRLRMRHNPFAVTQAARDRWMQLMEAALAETNLPPQAKQLLLVFFYDAATFMINS